MRPNSSNNDIGEDVDQLWRAFKDHGSAQARDRLILHYVPFVKFIVRRHGGGVPPAVERADLVSCATVGLIEAVERFDVTRGVKFETYAVPRIRGAMLDGLRAMDWVPRSVRSQARQLDSATRRLESELRRDPSEEELADELGANVTDVRARIEATATRSIVALDELTTGGEDEDSVPVVDTFSDDKASQPGSAVEALETKESLLEAIAMLGKRERLLIALYYFEGFTLTRIGEVFGVTVSRASQIHSKALLELQLLLTQKLANTKTHAIGGFGA